MALFTTLFTLLARLALAWGEGGKSALEIGRTKTKTEALTKRLSPACRLQRTARLARRLRSQHGARLRLRAERGPSPQELVKQASLAARLQDLDIIRLEAGIERPEPSQWDELRVWDPGDG